MHVHVHVSPFKRPLHFTGHVHSCTYGAFLFCFRYFITTLTIVTFLYISFGVCGYMVRSEHPLAHFSSLHRPTFSWTAAFYLTFPAQCRFTTSEWLVWLLLVFQSFGSETNEVITLNLPKGSSLDFAILVKCCLCLALFFTYPGNRSLAHRSIIPPCRWTHTHPPK